MGMKSGRLAVLDYLVTYKDKGLTSKEAFEEFGVTRLAAVIHDLREKHDIDTVIQEGVTRFGKSCRFARYYYRGKKDGNESTSN